MGLAVFDVEGGNHLFALEDTGIRVFQLVDEAALTRAGYDDALQTGGFDLRQDFGGSGHSFPVVVGAEEGGFFFVQAMDFFLGRVSSECPLVEDVERAGSCPSFIEVEV